MDFREFLNRQKWIFQNFYYPGCTQPWIISHFIVEFKRLIEDMIKKRKQKKEVRRFFIIRIEEYIRDSEIQSDLCISYNINYYLDIKFNSISFYWSNFSCCLNLLEFLAQKLFLNKGEILLHLLLEVFVILLIKDIWNLYFAL